VKCANSVTFSLSPSQPGGQWAWDRDGECLETFALNRDKGVSSLEDISEASILSIGQLGMEGAIVFAFGLHSALLHPRFQPPPTSLCWVLLSLSTRRGKGRGCEESIMELFKFVSNIEISFIPGELIIEVYRRTRRRLRMPGIEYGQGGRRIGEKWTFCFSLDYCFLLPEPIRILSLSLSLSLSRLFISPRGNENVSSASRRWFPFNFAYSQSPRLPRKWPANRKKTVVLKGIRFVKSYRFIRSVYRVPNKSINRINMRGLLYFARLSERMDILDAPLKAIFFFFFE